MNRIRWTLPFTLLAALAFPAAARHLDRPGPPLYFEANHGQHDRAVDFAARSGDLTVFLSGGEAVVVVVPGTSCARTSVSAVHLSLLGSRRGVEAVPGDALPGRVSYLVGNDPRAWSRGIPTYASVTYPEVYPGVDLVFHGDPQQLEFDLIVAAGTDPAPIRLGFDGADRIEMAPGGDLLLEVGGAHVRLRAPVAYQEDTDGRRQRVAARFAPLGPGEARIELGNFDPALPLVIDPVLDYASYLGGVGDDRGRGVAVDGTGIYVAGYTASPDFPTESPWQADLGGAFRRGFVTKLDPTGSSLIFSTYLGGTYDDTILDMAVDDNGYVYVTGRTASDDYPTLNAIQAGPQGDIDAFLTKLNTDGQSLVYSTYFGGDFEDWGDAIAVDTAGNAYVTGRTQSADLLIAGPLQPRHGGDTLDAYVFKVDGAGALIYSTYLGGNRNDLGIGIAADAVGNAYVVGLTKSRDFLRVNPLQFDYGGGEADGFLTKIDAAGTSWVYSTYVGGARSDVCNHVAVGPAGDLYLAGHSDSDDFPVVAAQQPTRAGSFDAFVMKLDPDAQTIAYSTYVGGAGDDRALRIAVDSAEAVAIVGHTDSPDLPLSRPFQPALAGPADSFVATLNRRGRSLWTSYLGGGEDDGGQAIALDARGRKWLSGWTLSADFPTARPYQPGFDGVLDAWVVGACLPGDVDALRAVRRPTPTDVRLSWQTVPAEGYDVWRTTDKLELPNTNASGSPPLVQPVAGCVPTAAPGCTDVGAVPVLPDTVFYYQVLGTCGGVEGP